MGGSNKQSCKYLRILIPMGAGRGLWKNAGTGPEKCPGDGEESEEKEGEQQIEIC